MKSYETPLDDIEKKLLAIAHANNEKAINGKFPWKSLLLGLGIFLGCLYLMVAHHAFGNPILMGLLGFTAFVAVFSTYSIPSSFFDAKQRRLTQRETLRKFLEQGTATRQKYECQRALRIGGYETEHHHYLLDVGEGLFSFLDVHGEMASQLPNTKFSIYADPEIRKILGDGFQTHGEKFTPYQILDQHFPSFPTLGRKMPEHMEFINSSLEDYLDKVLIDVVNV